MRKSRKDQRIIQVRTKARAKVKTKGKDNRGKDKDDDKGKDDNRLSDRKFLRKFGTLKLPVGVQEDTSIKQGLLKLRVDTYRLLLSFYQRGRKSSFHGSLEGG